MCGIGAIFDPTARTDPEAPARMVAALSHRGPDGSGIRDVGDATLVHTRLAIVDVAGGAQPLVSEDQACVAVVNGEIYNYPVLRDELIRLGHRFATHSDSEVVVHAYEEYGLDCVRHFNGMFAFVLWDSRLRLLVAARDPFGVKPLYWWSDGTRAVIASEVRALLASGLVPRGLDPIALDHYLTWRFVPAPRTLFSGVAKVPAASTLTIGRDGSRLDNYRAPPDPIFEGIGVPDLERQIRDRFVAAVRRQLMSDVPYGVFLSGGIDSMAIAAAVREATQSRPTAFTIGFPGHGDVLDERTAAAEGARAIGAEHHSMAMTETDFTLALGEAIRSLEEPCGTPSAPAVMQLSRFARKHVKVVLSGQGADEAFGGYERHQAGAALTSVDLLPGPVAGILRDVMHATLRTERMTRAADLLTASRGLDRLLRIFDITPEALRVSLTRSRHGVGAEERRELASVVLDDVPDRTPLEQLLYLDSHLFLPDQLFVYGDKMSMAAGLEQRVPFSDVELMRFVERVPGNLRVRHFNRKWIYRRAMRSLVPPAVFDRPKHPFATPYDHWLKANLGREIAARFSHGSDMAELCEPAVVDRLVCEHRSGLRDHKRALYCLLELSEWHRAFIGNEASSPPPAAYRGSVG